MVNEPPAHGLAPAPTGAAPERGGDEGWGIQRGRGKFWGDVPVPPRRGQAEGTLMCPRLVMLRGG